MAITNDQKIDFLWKKIGFKAAKTDTPANKGGPNEAIAATPRIDSQSIWAQSGDIPAVQPTATAGVVTVYSDGGSSSATVECTEDATATSQRSWKTGLTDWIDTSYGSTYLVKVYADDAGQTDPETGGTQMLGGESGYEWYFDYDAGVLHFIGTSIPGALSGKKVYVKGSRYTGNKGVPSSGGGSSHNLAFDPANLNDLHSTNTDGNINLDPNGDGQVVIEGTNSAVMPVGTTAQRGTATQGGIRYNTDTSSFEGYNGSAWAGMGGLIDIDQDTYICAEASSDADDLEFYTAGTKQLCIDQAGLITATSCIVGGSRIVSDSTTDATSTTDGSIQTDGGISAAKAIYAGTIIRNANASITQAGRIISDNTTDATNSTDGSVQTDGGISAAKAIFSGTTIDATTTLTAGGRILSNDTTNATSTSDGSVQTDGGLSVTCDGYIGGQLTVTGNLTVNGTTTTVNTATLTVDDKNIELGSVGTPDNTTADGGGITLKGATDKTINWVNSTAMWTFNQPIHVSSADDTLMHLASTDAGASLKLEDNGTGHLLITNTDDTTTIGSNGYSDAIKITSSAVIMNEAQNDRDFRVENDDDQNAFFVNGYGGTGVVGIGTAAPGAKLEVADFSDDSFVLVNVGTSANAKAGVRLKGDRLWQLVNDASNTYGPDNSFVIHDGTDNETRLLIDTTGNVGIGGDFTPETTLHVGATATGSAGVVGKPMIVASTLATVYAGDTPNSWQGIKTMNADGTSNRTATGIIFEQRASSSGVAAIMSTSAAADRADMRFITRGSGGIDERMIIDDDGKVGIGTTAPGYKLSVAGDIYSTTSIGIGTTPSGTTGEIRATNEITAYYSDRRLKVIEENGPGQDVEGKDAADVLTEISGVYYKESDEAKLFGYDNDKRQVGLIAQDVQKILPEIVVPAPFDIAEDGSSKSGEDYLTIKYEKVIPLLVNAINAQTGKITELKETVKLLERDMQDLKKALNIEILRDEPQVD